MGDFLVHNVRFFNFKPVAIHRLAYNEHECKLAVSRVDNSIEIWDLSKNAFQEKIIPGFKSRSVEALCWYQSRLFSTGLNGDLTEYDLLRLSPKSNYQVTSGACWCMKLSYSGNILAIGTEDGYISLYEVTSNGVDYLRLFEKQNDRIICLDWHQSGDHIVTGSVDVVQIWNAKSGRVVQTITVGRADLRKTTVVWCIKFTSDFQIISGDSRGKISFWDAKYGTLIDNIKSHQADILTLCLNKEEDCVYASGVDPLIVCCERVGRNHDVNHLRHWVKTYMRSVHTHDVRAITFAGTYLLSGGVDSYLMMLRLKENFRYANPPLPQSSLVGLANNKIILLRYPHHLELWKLGNTEKEKGLPQEVLPLSSDVTKLICIKAKESEIIVCSAVSNNSHWLAYSTTHTFRLFSITMDNKNSKKPTLERIHFTVPGDVKCHHMIFTPDSSKLILVKDNAIIQVFAIGNRPNFLYSLNPPTESYDSIHLIAVTLDGNYLATADHLSNIHVFNIETRKLHCTLPRHRFQPTALAFNPHSSALVVVHVDQKIIEFSIKDKELTTWSRSVLDFNDDSWFKKRQPTLGVSFDNCDDDAIIFYDDSHICVLRKSEVFQAAKHQKADRKSGKRQLENELEEERNLEMSLNPKELMPSNEKTTGFHYCHKYKHLLHFEVCGKGQAVAVEVNQLVLLESLPETLQRKKFGT